LIEDLLGGARHQFFDERSELGEDLGLVGGVALYQRGDFLHLGALFALPAKSSLF